MASDQPQPREASARGEWAAQWPLPIVAMLGIAGSATFVYSAGVFLSVLTAHFGWSRGATSSAFLIQTVLSLGAVPLVGRLIDSLGPRRVAIIGLCTHTLGVSLLGLANGSIGQWLVLCSVQGVLSAAIHPAVWIAAVASRFRASRGLALGIAFAGVGVASAIWPLLAATYITTFGWRLAFPALALSWTLPMIPLVLAIMPRPEARVLAPKRARHSDGAALRAAFRSPALLCLIIGGGLFNTVSFGLTAHLVPLARSHGLSLVAAASIASIAGIASITGRVGTGFLLDRLPLRTFALIVFLLPIIACTILLAGGTSTLPLAAAIQGLSTGAELDVLTFVVTRRVDARIFGTVYSVLVSALGAFAGVGPLAMGMFFDATRSYDIALLAAMPVVAAGAFLVWVGTAPGARF